MGVNHMQMAIRIQDSDTQQNKNVNTWSTDIFPYMPPVAETISHHAHRFWCSHRTHRNCQDSGFAKHPVKSHHGQTLKTSSEATPFEEESGGRFCCSSFAIKSKAVIPVWVDVSRCTAASFEPFMGAKLSSVPGTAALMSHCQSRPSSEIDRIVASRERNGFTSIGLPSYIINDCGTGKMLSGKNVLSCSAGAWLPSP